MKKFIERFSPTTTSVGSLAYLVLDLNNDEEVENFQVEMIASNNIPGVLPIDLRQRDDITSLYYNVTSKQPLSLIFQRKKFKRNEFITLLHNIVSSIDGCKKYLLSEDRFLLDENYIYVDSSTLDTSLVYLPIQLEGLEGKGIRDFINKLILEIANLDDENVDNYLQRIINYMRKDTLNLNDFNMFLKDLKGEKIIDPVEFSKPMKPRRTVEPIKSVEPARPVQVQQRPVEESSNSPVIPRVNIPKSQTSNKVPSSKKKKPAKNKKREKATQKYGETKMGYKTSTIIIAILSQVVLLGAIVSSWGKLSSINDNILTTIVGIVVVVGGIDYFLFKNLLSKENMVSKSKKIKDVKVKKAQEKKPINMDKREVRSMEKPIEYRESMDNNKFVNNRPSQNVEDEGVDETTFIGDISQEKRVYLQGSRNGVLEEININKDSFIIGRVKGQVDYVSDNRTIGKMHAEIINRDDNYYIRDLNSRNGTYLNNERIEGYKEYLLSNNDKITFSNSSFTFVILE